MPRLILSIIHQSTFCKFRNSLIHISPVNCASTDLIHPSPVYFLYITALSQASFRQSFFLYYGFACSTIYKFNLCISKCQCQYQCQCSLVERSLTPGWKRHDRYPIHPFTLPLSVYNGSIQFHPPPLPHSSVVVFFFFFFFVVVCFSSLLSVYKGLMASTC